MEMCLHEGREDGFWATPEFLMKYGIYEFDDLFISPGESIYSLQHAYIEEKIQDLEKELAKCRADLKIRNYERLLEYQKELSGSYTKKALHNRYVDCAFGFNRENYKEDFDEFVLFLERFPVILSTVDLIRDSIRRNYVYDYMIVLEASEMDITAWLRALSCCKRAVFVGDSKQPPQNLMSSVIGSFADQVPQTFLREQYLCHPDIIRFFNEKVYEGELIAYKENEPGDADSTSYRDQAKKLAYPLGIQYENTNEFERYTGYIRPGKSDAGSDEKSVFELLYRDYNSVLLLLQNRFAKRSKYKSRYTLNNKINDILKDEKFKHLRYTYNLRLPDIQRMGDWYSVLEKEAFPKTTADFVFYDVFDKRPALLIQTAGTEKIKETLLERAGIHLLKLSGDSEDDEKRMLKSITCL
jgi:hypothetical protein